MIKARGMAISSKNAPFTLINFDRRELLDHDVQIEIHFCGICHSDIHQAQNDWKRAQYPMIPGHEITGIVTSVGKNVRKFKLGDPVGVGCMIDSCLQCSSCKNHEEQFCIEGATYTYNSPSRDGTEVTKGGYSNTIVVREEFVLKIPDALDLKHAAPLLCAGITLFSPLTHWKVQKNSQIAIIGLGGLGHMGLKIAHAMGAQVTIISHNEQKKNDAYSMNAVRFINSKQENFHIPYQQSFDLIINTTSIDCDFSIYLSMLKVNGTLVSVGLPEKPVIINPIALIAGRKSFAGSLIGGVKETQECLDFCAKNQVTPMIEMITPYEIDEAYAKIINSKARYRIVMDLRNF